mmetsp:Transcript_769/g.1136  ORF Transcript_769/g.1136 Transcript_769/m.1136 type:complete len:451 (-) Transcript_769:321-1673(-)
MRRRPRVLVGRVRLRVRRAGLDRQDVHRQHGLLHHVLHGGERLRVLVLSVRVRGDGRDHRRRNRGRAVQDVGVPVLLAHADRIRVPGDRARRLEHQRLPESSSGGAAVGERHDRLCGKRRRPRHGRHHRPDRHEDPGQPEGTVLRRAGERPEQAQAVPGTFGGAPGPRILHPLVRLVRLQHRLDADGPDGRQGSRRGPRRDQHDARRRRRGRRRPLHEPRHHGAVHRRGDLQPELRHERMPRGPRLHHVRVRRHGALGGHRHGHRGRSAVPVVFEAAREAEDRRRRRRDTRAHDQRRLGPRRDRTHGGAGTDAGRVRDAGSRGVVLRVGPRLGELHPHGLSARGNMLHRRVGDRPHDAVLPAVELHGMVPERRAGGGRGARHQLPRRELEQRGRSQVGVPGRLPEEKGRANKTTVRAALHHRRWRRAGAAPRGGGGHGGYVRRRHGQRKR